IAVRCSLFAVRCSLPATRCPAVYPSIRLSVCPSVRLSARPPPTPAIPLPERQENPVRRLLSTIVIPSGRGGGQFPLPAHRSPLTRHRRRKGPPTWPATRSSA